MSSIIVISLILMLVVLILTVLAISSGYKHEAMKKQEMDPIPPHLEELAKQSRKAADDNVNPKK